MKLCSFPGFIGETCRSCGTGRTDAIMEMKGGWVAMAEGVEEEEEEEEV